MRRKNWFTPGSAKLPANSLDDALNEIATLAKISNDAGRTLFSESVRLLVEDICRMPVVEKLQLFSAREVASLLRAVERKAQALCDDLKKMSRATGARAGASKFFHAALIEEQRGEAVSLCSSQRSRQGRRDLWFQNIIDDLDLVTKAAAAAASDICDLHNRTMRIRAERSRKHSAAGRPTGTRGNVGFDIFVIQLLTDARRMGGSLTIYKWESPNADEGWGGSLLKAVRLLQPHLPARYFPKTNLGRTLNRIANG
jgi:hypothetical protein